jgi:hypothetical protein
MKLRNILSENQPTKQNTVPVTDKDKIVYYVHPELCERFFKQYPLVKSTMLKFVGGYGKVLAKYNKFISFKNKNEDKLGGKAKTVDSPSFGTKTFYEYDFPKSSNGTVMFAELFQYLILKNK